MPEDCQLDMDRIPQHIAIIMDGNGRWAKQRDKKRSEGHRAGAETVETIIETAARLGVKYLTLYTFSVENWDRPIDEVSSLMELLFDSLKEEMLIKNKLRLQIIGDMKTLPEKIQEKLRECIEDTSHEFGMTLVLALSYSSHCEITEATRQIVRMVQKGEITPEKITPDLLSQHMSTRSMPNPDLLIRTGGEVRLSNFLLWQCAYSELYFCDTYWPDFRQKEFYKAIEDYQGRERRFGKTSEQIS
jgi:undecaprenyl diphosphate synthase